MSLIFYNLVERDNGSLLKLIVLIFTDYYGLKLGRNYCRFVSRFHLRSLLAKRIVSEETVVQQLPG